MSLSRSAVLSLLALVGSALAVPAPAGADEPTLTPAGAAGGVEAGKPLNVTSDHDAGTYVVVLRDEPTASYGAKQARARTDRLAREQQAVAASVGVTPLASYTVATNGFAAELTAGQAARLAADPRVATLAESELLQVADASTSTGYLGLEGDGGVWDSIGGVANAGKGVVVGVVDTGIAPENPSFAGPALGTTDGAAPYRDGSDIVFHKSDGSDFTGACVAGVQFTAAACSTKVIGARYFVDGFGTGNLGSPAAGEYLSPRDGDGHGSHTSSTAAGDTDVAAGGKRISGVTPAAKIAVYKACWSGPDPESRDDDGCTTVDLLAAIDAAVGDGVDVINYSIGGGSATTTNSLTDQAFRRAAAAGVFVAAAAGNAGPDVSTVDNAAPWVTTVAASSMPTPGDPSVPAPQVADFSSRGPVEADGSDLIKPDVAAPGVDVLAAEGNPQGGAPTWGYLSGTSMASPHVAGLAALYLSTKPDATPAEVKSALMTSAVDTVDADGAPATDPFAQGNGQVHPASYLQPGLVYLNDDDDWSGYLAGIGEPTAPGVDPIDGSDLNLPSVGIGGLAGTQTVTRTVTATAPGTFTASVSGLAGVDAIVTPASLTFAAAGESHSFTVTFDRTDAPLGDFVSGYLDWTSSATPAVTVRSALAVRPVAFDAPSEVAGTGTTGSATITASVGDDAQVPLVTEGLAHGSVVEGTGAAGGSSHRYAVTVPDDATFLRFDLDAADDTADLDLTVYRRSANGNVSEMGQSATGSADERVDLGYAPGGTYVVDVDFYAAGASGPELDYALTSYVVSAGSTAGTLTVDPASIDGHVGDTPTITASWSGLEPGAYLGLVRFGDTGVSTVVTVDAGSDAPVAPGTPALAVSPDASGWAALGSDLRVTGTGLTPGASYGAAIDDGPVARTGKASAQGTVDWAVPLGSTLAPGDHVLHLTGPGADLTAAFRVTPVAIVGGFGFPSPGFDGHAYTRLDLTYRGTGDVRLYVESAETGEVFLDEVQHVVEIPALPSTSTQSRSVRVVGGELHATATVVLPDGTDGPTYTFDPFYADTAPAGSITFTPTAGDADLVTVAIENNAGTSFNPMVHYYGCDGRQVYANGFLKDGPSTQTWDLTGFTRVEVVDDHDVLLASYDNAAPDRCAGDGTDVTVFQDYWATYTATPRTSDTYDADRPITLELSNRYAPYSQGFDMLIGEGVRNETNPFFYEAIGVDEITVRGPVISRTVTVPEGVPTWAQTYWEAFIDPPGIQLLGTAWVDVPALTVEELTAHPVTIGAVTPKVSGTPAVGRTLRALPGAWKPAAVRLGYQWLRDGKPIAGATTARYTPVGRDAGHRVAVRVTGTAAGAVDVTRTSKPVTVKRVMTATPKPRIAGTPKVGEKLTAATGTWKPGAVRLTVQWLRDGKAITGSHARVHVLRAADRGHRITVRVTGRRAGYLTVTRTSAPRTVR